MIHFAGTIDDVRIWSIERTATEIAGGYQAPLDPATAGLQGYWKLDETGGAATAADAVTPGYPGFLSGFTFEPSPWVPGKI